MGIQELIEELGRATNERPVALGRYDVTGLIGRGGMGTVYSAVDREHGTEVALKTLTHLEPSSLLRFKNEFRSVADLTHPNLIALYELGVHEDLWYFTMARIEGVDLLEWLRGEPIRTSGTSPRTLVASPRGEREAKKRNDTDDDIAIPTPPPSIERVREALGQIVAGVHALHRAGYLHLDIKPSNVLVDEAGQVYLLDFGLVRRVDAERTTDGRDDDSISISGTPMWMAPEQFTDAPIGKPADWYAVGLMLYTGLTGVSAFPEGSTEEMARARQAGEPAAPRDHLPKIPEDLSELAMAMLRTAANERPSGELLVELTAGGDAAAEARKADFVGRIAELDALRGAHQIAGAGDASAAHLIGTSGLGKSALLSEFCGDVRASGGIAVQGRCYERESVPYKAFDGLLDELAAVLADRDEVEVVASLPEWIRELVRVFPVLATVPVIEGHLAARPSEDDTTPIVEVRRRAVEALRELLVNLTSNETLVLAIDDLQWADADSVALLVRLVSPPLPRLLLVVSYRPAEAEANQDVAPYLELTETLGELLTTINLEPLESDDAIRLASIALSALDISTDLAAAIAAESAGVPFFIEELAQYATQYAASVSDAAVGDGITLEAVLGQRVKSLPDEQRALVEVLSVANSPIPLFVAFELAGIRGGALRALWGLRGRRLVRTSGARADDRVELHHDRMRESVTGYLSRERIDDIHLALGQALSEDDMVDAWLYDAVRHLNAVHHRLDGPARIQVARLNLDAGRKARRSAAFPLAFDCFRAGARLIADGAWTDHYDLALGLFSGAAEGAYLDAAWDELDGYVNAVKANARIVLDQVPAWETQIDACIGRNDYAGAIEAAVEVLRHLGEDLPPHPGEAEVGAAVQAAMERLKGVGPVTFADLPDVDDPTVAAAMRIQTRITSAAYFGRPMLLPVLACRLVVTSVDRGLSPATPYALSVFGIVLNTLGMHPEAHIWGQVALRLIDRFDDRSLEARTRHVSNNLVCTWMVPLDSTLADMKAVVDIGMATGDVEYAAYAAHAYIHNAIYAGRPLEPLLAEAVDYGELMRGHEQVNALHVHEPFEQMIRCLIGAVEDPSRLDGHGFEEASSLAAAQEAGSRSAQCLIRCIMGMVRYHFDDPVDASRVFEEARPFLDGMPSVWHTVMFHQFAALAICRLDDGARAALTTELDNSIAELRRLEAFYAPNFAHRLAMVEAERARAEGNSDAAMAGYRRAIELADQAGWTNDAALANELAARFSGDAAHADAARDAYRRWGANAKVTRI